MIIPLCHLYLIWSSIILYQTRPTPHKTINRNFILSSLNSWLLFPHFCRHNLLKEKKIQNRKLFFRNIHSSSFTFNFYSFFFTHTCFYLHSYCTPHIFFSFLLNRVFSFIKNHLKRITEVWAKKIETLFSYIFFSVGCSTTKQKMFNTINHSNFSSFIPFFLHFFLTILWCCLYPCSS